MYRKKTEMQKKRTEMRKKRQRDGTSQDFDLGLADSGWGTIYL